MRKIHLFWDQKEYQWFRVSLICNYIGKNAKSKSNKVKIVPSVRRKLVLSFTRKNEKKKTFWGCFDETNKTWGRKVK